MSFFNIKKQAVEPGQRQESDLAGFSFDDVKTDYLYLDMLPTEMPDEMWARIRSVMNLFKKEALSPSVITGDLELDATSRFMSYRDKKKLFYRRLRIIIFMMTCIIAALPTEHRLLLARICLNSSRSSQQPAVGRIAI